MGIIDKIRTYSQASTESDTEYYGFLSYAVEYHATTWGIGHGIATGAALIVAPVIASHLLTAFAAVTLFVYTGRKSKRIDLADKYLTQIKKEPQYYLGSFLVGILPGGAYGYLTGTLPEVQNLIPF